MGNCTSAYIVKPKKSIVPKKGYDTKKGFTFNQEGRINQTQILFDIGGKVTINDKSTVINSTKLILTTEQVQELKKFKQFDPFINSNLYEVEPVVSPHRPNFSELKSGDTSNQGRCINRNQIVFYIGGKHSITTNDSVVNIKTSQFNHFKDFKQFILDMCNNDESKRNKNEVYAVSKIELAPVSANVSPQKNDITFNQYGIVNQFKTVFSIGSNVTITNDATVINIHLLRINKEPFKQFIIEMLKETESVVTETESVVTETESVVTETESVVTETESETAKSVAAETAKSAVAETESVAAETESLVAPVLANVVSCVVDKNVDNNVYVAYEDVYVVDPLCLATKQNPQVFALTTKQNPQVSSSTFKQNNRVFASAFKQNPLVSTRKCLKQTLSGCA